MTRSITVSDMIRQPSSTASFQTGAHRALYPAKTKGRSWMEAIND